MTRRRKVLVLALGLGVLAAPSSIFYFLELRAEWRTKRALDALAARGWSLAPGALPAPVLSSPLERLAIDPANLEAWRLRCSLLNAIHEDIARLIAMIPVDAQDQQILDAALADAERQDLLIAAERRELTIVFTRFTPDDKGLEALDAAL